jgi:hypothetical protein
MILTGRVELGMELSDSERFGALGDAYDISIRPTLHFGSYNHLASEVRAAASFLPFWMREDGQPFLIKTTKLLLPCWKIQLIIIM